MTSEYPRITNFGIVGDIQNQVLGSPIASAAIISPDRGIHHVTGVAAIDTITIPWDGFAGTIFLIADGLWSWTNAGNINSAGSATSVGQVIQFTYDLTANKWFPIVSGASIAGNNTWTGTNEFTGQTNISGPDANTNVEIGSVSNDANAGTGGTSVVIGNNASNAANGANAIIIGSGISSGGAGCVQIGQGSVIAGTITDAVGIGRANSTKGTGVVAIGATSSVSNSNGIAIGSGANAAGSSIAIGAGAISSPTAFQLVVGSSTTPMDTVYFGKGVVNATPTPYTINGTGGSGTNIAGADIHIAGGKGTGNAKGGDASLQTSFPLGSGTTLQTLYDRTLVVGGLKALTGGAATAVVRFGVPQGLDGGFGATVFYSIRASDGADFQIRRGSVHIAAVNKAGTEVPVLSAASEAADGSIIAQSSASTLTYAITAASSVADTVDLSFNVVSGLVETTLDIQYTVLRDHGTGTITPL